MFEFAAFGFVTLVWWTWPAIAGIVFGSMYLAMLVSTRRDRKEEKASGPYPCLAHLGTEPDGMEWWCWLREGHAGVHLNQWGVDVNQPMVAPGGPDPEPYAGSLCEWGEDGDDNESACWKPAGHDGPHMIMDQVTDAGGHVYNSDDYPEQNFHS